MLGDELRAALGKHRSQPVFTEVCTSEPANRLVIAVENIVLP